MKQFQHDALVNQYKSLSKKHSKLNGFKDLAEFIETWKAQKTPDKTIQLEAKNVAYRPNEDENFGPDNIKWRAVLDEGDWGNPTHPVLEGRDE